MPTMKLPLFLLAFASKLAMTNAGYCWGLCVYCIANDTLIETPKGTVATATVQPGDYVRGVKGVDMEPSWCKVIANPDHGVGHVIGDFTPGHFIAAPHEGGNDEVTIVPHMYDKHPANTNWSRVNGARVTGLRNVATECELAETASGQLFAPFSTAFCQAKELSWADYRVLVSSILKLTKEVGFVWDLRNWHENETHPFYGSLPTLCADIIDCAKDATDSDACARFEYHAAALVDSNLESSKKTSFRQAFPNSNAMNRAMHDLEQSHPAALGLVGTAAILACLALLLLVVYLLVRLRRASSHATATSKTAAKVVEVKVNKDVYAMGESKATTTSDKEAAATKGTPGVAKDKGDVVVAA